MLYRLAGSCGFCAQAGRASAMIYQPRPLRETPQREACASEDCRRLPDYAN
jgi:hypothetical protein